MFDSADRRLMEWAVKVLAEADASHAGGNGTSGTEAPGVVLDPPTASASHATPSGVSLYLMECVSAPPPRGPRRPPLQATLRYVVTTWASKQEEAHRLLGVLLFAAMDDPDLEVDAIPLPASTWQAFGTVPQPSIVLAVPFKQERAEPPVKYVRVPLVVQAAPVVTLSGTVVGPGDIPVAGARVDLADLKLYARTDQRGRFSFKAVPGGPRPLSLRVLAKGKEMAFLVEKPSSDSPVTIKFDTLGTQEE